MKTVEFIIENYNSECFDGRDINRLVQFLSESQLEEMGIQLKEEYKGKHQPIPFTKENVLKQLKGDLEFGWSKARNQRGISASMMYEVVRMWNWILEDGLEDFDNYGSYGFPLFTATAKKYDWLNELD